jgi:hypothetical protein
MKMKKNVPKVLKKAKEAVKTGNSSVWGKDVGGPYPWSKK